MTPDYTLGCKRVLRSDDYWPAFNRDNVHLVTDGIASLFEGGIETVNGERIQLDVIIHCTGFNVADFNYPIKIVNADGTELFQTLRNTGGAAYKGTVVSGFPNFFILMGPNTGLGDNSVVHIMESQAQLYHTLPASGTRPWHQSICYGQERRTTGIFQQDSGATQRNRLVFRMQQLVSGCKWP